LGDELVAQSLVADLDEQLARGDADSVVDPGVSWAAGSGA
jgi:hypothetical protein